MREKITSKGLSVNTQGRLPGIYLGIDGKESACSAGDWSSIPGLGRSLGEDNGHLLQYSCLGEFHRQGSLVCYSYSMGNSMDRGAWWAIVHRVPKSWT